jgi:phosphatidylinositol glycan class P protein
MIFSVVFFVTFVAWSLIPDSVLISFGVSYFPNKYWAVALPLYLVMFGLFTVASYIALSMYYNPDLHDLRLAEDRFSKVHPPSQAPISFPSHPNSHSVGAEPLY